LVREAEQIGGLRRALKRLIYRLEMQLAGAEHSRYSILRDHRRKDPMKRARCNIVLEFLAMCRLLVRVVMSAALACGGTFQPHATSAQEIDFGKIDKFESLGTGALHVGSPPETIVDDNQRHVVILTIWDAHAETKVYWRSPDGMLAARPLCPDPASKHSTRWESSNLRPSVNPIMRSNTAT
jgi:hypothetical protein